MTAFIIICSSQDGCCRREATNREMATFAAFSGRRDKKTGCGEDLHGARARRLFCCAATRKSVF